MQTNIIKCWFKNKIFRIFKNATYHRNFPPTNAFFKFRRRNKTEPQRVYQALCVAYFAQTLCQDSSLWFFEQHLEASKAKAFAGETKG